MTTPFPNPSGLPELAAIFTTNASGAITSGGNAAGHVFVSGLYGTSPPPTVAAGAGAGAGATVGSQVGFDLGGSFVVTTAGVPAAGALATVTFGTALSAAPAAVLVTCWDQTGAAGLLVGSTSITATGFTVSGPAATAAHALLVTYMVLLRQP